jgi:hypothetical protein
MFKMFINVCCALNFEMMLQTNGVFELMWRVMGANVRSLTPIKTQHSCGNKSRSFMGGVRKWTLTFDKNYKIF